MTTAVVLSGFAVMVFLPCASALVGTWEGKKRRNAASPDRIPERIIERKASMRFVRNDEPTARAAAPLMRKSMALTQSVRAASAKASARAIAARAITTGAAVPASVAALAPVQNWPPALQPDLAPLGITRHARVERAEVERAEMDALKAQAAALRAHAEALAAMAHAAQLKADAAAADADALEVNAAHALTHARRAA